MEGNKINKQIKKKKTKLNRNKPTNKQGRQEENEQKTKEYKTKTLNILFKQQVNVHRSRASDPKHCDVQRNEQCKWDKQIWNKDCNQTKKMQQQK